MEHFILYFVKQASSEQRENKLKYFIDCAIIEHGTFGDVVNIMNHELPRGRNGNCMLACVDEKLGFVSLLDNSRRSK